MRTTIEKEIVSALDRIRPAIAQHLGDIEFVRFEKGVAYVRLLGACTHCPLAGLTLKAGVEETLTSEVKGVERVEAVEN